MEHTTNHQQPAGNSGTSREFGRDRNSADVVIIGGGVAGLWCRWALIHAGYGVAMIERTSLGDGQSVLAQGILHRGVKYAFSPQGAEAAQAAQAAASEWDRAMKGEAGPDLRGIRVLAKSMLMWTSTGIVAKVTGAVASRMMTSHVRGLQTPEIPELLANRGGNVYEVAETVIEPLSALQMLAGACDGPIVQAGVQSIRRDGDRLLVETDRMTVETSWIIFAAGAGNEHLLQMVGEKAGDWSQRRPLHMVSVIGAPAALFGHWIASASDKPRLTITSDETPRGIVWYLGGDIAEIGVARSKSEQIAAARTELRECFPSIDTSAWQFDAFRIDRAEGKDAAGRRPDGPVVRSIESMRTSLGGVIAVWPTKLVLAPVASDLVCGIVAPSAASRSGQTIGFSDSKRPDYALPPWRTQE